ncbi:MAG: hypothetical protein KatS3mg102_0237 [Planctomycetota bacterium]|nr:MAG: hypothetical protein KatS3mg102_0237 [Planctomycetota bacterium]
MQALVAALGRTAHAEARAQALQRHGELMQLYERERLGSQASARSAAFVQAGLELLGTAALPAQEQVALALAVADSAYVAARQSGVPLERQQLAQAQQSAEQLLARFQVARELGGIDRRLTEEDFRWSAGLIERGWLEREPPRELATALALGLRQRAAETCTRIASDAQQLLASGGLQTLSPAALQALQQEATQLLRKGVLEQPAQLQAVASVAGGAAARLASLARQGAAAR